MSTLKKIYLAAALALTLTTGASAQSLPANSALILYDGSGQYGWIGGLYGRMLANLLGHFDLSYQIAPVENYQAGQMDGVRATFYFGSVYDNPLPAAFKSDALATTNALCWFRYNLWQIADTNFTAKFGFQFNFLDWSGYSNIIYKGESFLKNQLDPELGYVTVLNSNLASTVATATKADGTSIPYVTRSGNFWYVGDAPLAYISEEDRYIVFADLLHDILGINHPTSHSAVIRIEDVAPSTYPPADLRATADTLRAENVPFAIALVPVFRDPLAYQNSSATQHRMSDAADPASVDFVSAIRYMLTNGAQLLIHGYTHQYNNVINPYTGVSGDDFEFWRETFSDPNTLTIDIYAPVPEDSASWALGRMNAAKAELAAVGMAAAGWEFPHYAASEIDSRVAATNFPLCMHRVLYFDAAGHIAGQFFPYVINRDIYGQKIIPENIGNIEPQPWFNYPVRLPADLIRAARKNLVVRDGWANGYFHPFFNLNYLRDTVRGIKALGYTYVTLPEPPPPAGTPPAITAQPQSRTNVVGTSASFSVTATGTAPLAYQWRFNGANIGDATNTSHTIASVQTNNAGGYDVVVANSIGTVTSVVATLTVGVPPATTAQPQSLTNPAGTSATFSVAATGTAPLRYQWQFNSVNFAGATNATLTLNNVQSANAGSYCCVVANAFGSATSLDATLTVIAPPAITAQPQSRTNNVGTSASFSVTATGTAPLRYQWRFNGADIGDATNTSYTIASAQTDNAGGYTAVVANDYGAVTSVVATLTVGVPPAITAQPQSLTNTAGTSATFTVAATGTALLRYQWQFNSANIAGATNATLTLNNVQSANAGNYRCVVANAYGSATSSTATLTVIAPPAITAQPQSRTNNIGTSASFSVTATGTAPLRYQWRFNGANIGGATNSTYTIASVQTNNAGGYAVVVANNYGSVTSAVAVLTVTAVVAIAPPVITSQPKDQFPFGGQPASFSVTATGTAPLTYQWRHDGVNIPGATNSTYYIPAVNDLDGGRYRVRVSNAYGTVLSASAKLNVQ